jgi:hypothetical protein
LRYLLDVLDLIVLYPSYHVTIKGDQEPKFVRVNNDDVHILAICVLLMCPG